MTDPYLYIKVVFIINAIALPLYLIFTDKGVVDKCIRTVLVCGFMIWQATILLNKAG